MSRLLIALQYCRSDAAVCFELGSLLAKLGPHNPLAGVLFWQDEDAPPPPPELIQALEEHHTVFVHSPPTCATGWPDGPNEMWQWLVKNLLNPAFCPGYDHVLTTEPDSVPMRPDWSVELLKFHEAAVARGALMTGHVCTAPGTHVNGNMIVRRDIAARLPIFLRRLPKGKAWDYEHRELILQHAEDNPWLMSDYKCHRKDSIALWQHDKGKGVCGWLHGVKGWHGLDEANRRLFPPDEAIPRILHQVVLGPLSEASADLRAAHAASNGWECRMHGREALEEWQEHPRIQSTDATQLARLEQRLAALILHRDGGWFVANNHELMPSLTAAYAELPGATCVAIRHGDAPSCRVLGCTPQHPVMQALTETPDMADYLDKARRVTWLPSDWCRCLGGETVTLPSAEIPRFVCVAKGDDGGWLALGAALNKHVLEPVVRHHREVTNRPAVILRVVRSV